LLEAGEVRQQRGSVGLAAQHQADRAGVDGQPCRAAAIGPAFGEMPRRFPRPSCARRRSRDGLLSLDGHGGAEAVGQLRVRLGRRARGEEQRTWRPRSLTTSASRCSTR
jgi:hypothetical protein